MQFQDAALAKIGKTDDGLFLAVDEQNNRWTGKKLLLATGVKDIYPDIPGYDACWVKGM